MTAPTQYSVQEDRRARAFRHFSDYLVANDLELNSNVWPDLADRVSGDPVILNDSVPGSLPDRITNVIPATWQQNDRLMHALHQSMLILIGRDLSYGHGARVRLLTQSNGHPAGHVGRITSVYSPNSPYVDLDHGSVCKWHVIAEPGIDWSNAEAVKQAWLDDMARLSDALNGEALRRRWCGEYETFQRACNEWLTFELTARDQEYTCRIKVEVTFEWEDQNDSRYHQGQATLWFNETNTAADEDAAMDMVNTTESEWIDRARTMIRPLGYLSEFDVTNVEVDSVELAD